MNAIISTKENKLFFKKKISLIEKKFNYVFSNEELSIWFNFFTEFENGLKLFEEVCNLIYINCRFLPSLDEIEKKEIIDYNCGGKNYKRTIIEIAKRKLIKDKNE